MVDKPVVVLSSVVELVQPVLYQLVVDFRTAAVAALVVEVRIPVVCSSESKPILDGHERGRYPYNRKHR